jgi:ribosomal protein L40E
MKGPLNVIRRRRAGRPAKEPAADQAATETPTTAPPASDSGSPATADAASQTEPSEPASQGSPVPAGQDPVPTNPSFRHRGRMRRRLRYLRRVRELGFRDLGGLVFDQHRFSSVNEELVRGKLAALAAVDRELRALEHALDDRRPLTELREPGISVCARCGALHGSEARYCPSCGVPVHGPLAIGEVGEAVTFGPGELGAASAPPEVEPQPAATEVAEREAAKAQAEAAAASLAPVTHPPTEVMRPVAEPQSGRPVAEPQSGRPVAEPPSGDGEPPRLAQPTAKRSEP